MMVIDGLRNVKGLGAYHYGVGFYFCLVKMMIILFTIKSSKNIFVDG